MRRTRTIPTLAAGLALTLLGAGAAHANQIPGPVITGSLDSIQGADSITVNGQTYTIAPGSPAQEELGSLTPGEQVDVQLNGPASSPDSQVVNVVVHEGS